MAENLSRWTNGSMALGFTGLKVDKKWVGGGGVDVCTSTMHVLVHMLKIIFDVRQSHQVMKSSQNICEMQ